MAAADVLVGGGVILGDGSVQSGPAPAPLPETAVKVRGGEVVRA